MYLGTLHQGEMSMEEVHRFTCEPILLGEYYYTDILRLYAEMLAGIKKLCARGIQPHSLAIDTWGVDCGYVNAEGELIANPINYRSERTKNTPEKLASRGLTTPMLFETTGISPMPYNSLYQVSEDWESRSQLLAPAHKVLLLPDLLGYWLCGHMSTEPCIASTTQMLHKDGSGWVKEIVSTIGLDEALLPDIQETGTQKGMLCPSLAQALGCEPFAIIAGCSHDTAAAVLACPLRDENSVFISSGSWSLMGQQRTEAITTPEALAAGFSNELGYGRSVRFLKSINGLWTLQLLQRKWGISFAQIEDEARLCMDKGFCVDVTDPAFYEAGDVEATLLAHCEKNNLPIPQSRGEMAAAVYEGLGQAHGRFLSVFESLTGSPISSLHIMGGGCKDKIFCDSIAKHVNVPVTLGPIDATAAGNLLSQWLGMGLFSTLTEARECLQRSIF